MFRSSPTRSSLFPPSSWCVLVCDLPRFEAHQLAPPTSSPPAGETLFVTCHISKLNNPLLPLLPSQLGDLGYAMPHFYALQSTHPSSAPPSTQVSFSPRYLST